MTAPVETLREAARLMRERAEAVDEIGVETWDGYRHLGPDNAEEHEHIASWHPAVALAVADLLDREADTAARFHDGRVGKYDLAVARVYLGEAS